MPVKILFTFLLPYFIISSGCVQSKNKVASTQSEVAQQPFDTLQKIRIDSIVGQIDVGVRAQGLPSLLAFPIYHQNDTIKYWSVNDEPERISLAMKSGETIIWPTFFVSNGELVFVRYRASHGDNPSPYAEESMVYLKDGIIVYCEERKTSLQPGESPASLRQKSYMKSTRSLAEIEKDYSQYWLTVKDALNQKTGKSIK